MSVERAHNALDRERMTQYRYARLQTQVRHHNCAGVLLSNPMNVRYATDTHYAQITNMHSPFRFVFVPGEGKAVLYDSATGDFASLPVVVGERREAIVSAYFIAGGAYSQRSRQWAAEVGELVRSLGDGSRRVAVDMAEPEFLVALQAQGLTLINADKLVEQAGAVKSEDELLCLAASAAVAERGLREIRDNLRPGITEQALWAHLVRENAASGGEWFEYSVLCSGVRTNPWGQECSDKIILAGELVGVDTGMIGASGYGADISRTFYCQPGEPTAEQRRLYQTALDNLHFNIDRLHAGMGFREFAQKSWPVPDEFWARRYNCLAHGVGMGNEWPHIPFAAEWHSNDLRDGVFEENMVLAVEACIGCEDGIECVKLEEMVVLEKGGCRLLSSFPFESALGAGEHDSVSVHV